MSRSVLIKKIKQRAEDDKLKRKDIRFLKTMGFLVSKGFLKVNYNIPNLPNMRLHIEDAIWAGKNIEPRILEVLPAAVLRLKPNIVRLIKRLAKERGCTDTEIIESKFID